MGPILFSLIAIWIGLGSIWLNLDKDKEGRHDNHKNNYKEV